MMPDAPTFAPILTTAIALVAVLVARRGVASSAGRSASAAKVRTLYTLVALLLALRIVAQFWPSTTIVVLLMLVAAWLPMAGLRLVEELRRRHAPKTIKLVAVFGAAAFSVVALTVGLVWSLAAALALAGYQALMTAAMVLLLAGSRGAMAPAELRTADTFLIALLLTIPLAATDFSAVLPDAPVRGGAFAVLILVLATSRLAEGDGSPRWLLADMAVAAGGGGLVLLAGLAPPGDLPANAAIALAANGAAIAALLLLVERFGAVRNADGGIIAALARAPGGDARSIIAAHPLLASGRILGPVELADYPAASLDRLVGHRVIGADIADREARDAARDLLDANAATHLVRLSVDPPSFLAVNTGGLAAPALDDELAIAARLIEGRT